jgi:hypothetical protein
MYLLGGSPCSVQNRRASYDSDALEHPSIDAISAMLRFEQIGLLVANAMPHFWTLST